MRAKLLVVIAAFASACEEQSGMALLDHPQILAVRAEPPAIPAGGQARIDILAGDSAGAILLATPESMTAVTPAPLAQRDGDGWFLAAPSEDALAQLRRERGLAADAPVPMTIEVSLTVDGLELDATKTVFLGAEGQNPIVEGTAVPASFSPEGDARITARGAGGSGELSYAWYTSYGDLDDYRSAEATYLPPAETGSGELLVVIRDAAGGVCWEAVLFSVE